MNRKDFLIIGAGLTALVVIVLLALLVPQGASKEVKVITDKTEYKAGDALKVKIENNLSQKMCLSSCFPYYWEKKAGEEWKGYQYIDCQASDLVERCVEPKQVKAFELTIPSIGIGPHRLAVPACIGCSLQEAFRKDQWFYSNDFVIE